MNNKFNEYLLNSKIEKKFDINKFNFVNIKLDNFKSKSTKMVFEKFLLLNFIIAFLCQYFFTILNLNIL